MSRKYEILPACQRYCGWDHYIKGFPWLPISSKLRWAMGAPGRSRLCAKVDFWHLQPGTKLWKWLCESLWLVGPHGQIPYGRVREWWIVFVAVAPSGGWISYWNIKVWNFNIISFSLKQEVWLLFSQWSSNLHLVSECYAGHLGNQRQRELSWFQSHSLSDQARW